MKIWFKNLEVDGTKQFLLLIRIDMITVVDLYLKIGSLLIIFN